MDGQRESVKRFIVNGNWEVIGECAEVESGKRNARPELQKALALCRQHKATLIIAKLDRLSRNAAFLLNLQESGVKFIAVDMPQADNFTVGIMALVAQKEREATSTRTIQALQQAKRRGTRLGNPSPANALKAALKAKQERARAFVESLAPVVKAIQKAKMTSLREICFCLNTRGYKSPNGREFKPQTVKNLLLQIEA
jgi:DNA invertase Pin-like site-specific DNA recombinase